MDQSILVLRFVLVQFFIYSNFINGPVNSGFKVCLVAFLLFIQIFIKQAVSKPTTNARF